MRALVSSILLIAGAVVGCAHPGDRLIGRSETPTLTSAPTDFDDADPAALALFERELEPFGTWTVDRVAGTVWIPHESEAGADFVPFASHGHFTYRTHADAGDGKGADEGTPEWIWVSDKAWGWATSHYGRWTFLATENRWAWVPGRRYAGAWVTFRVSEQCSSEPSACVVGWGPKAPTFAWRGEEAVRRPGQTSLFVYARAADLFEADLKARLLSGQALLEAAGQSPLASTTPTAEELGLSKLPMPPLDDPGLRKALLLATPESTHAMSAAPRVGRHTFRSYVTGGPRYLQPVNHPR